MSNAERVRKYREKNREKCKDISNAWQKANPDKVAAYATKYNRIRNGFSEDLFALTSAFQEQRCAICKTPFAELSKRSVHADHDHVTKEARGVLCHACNVGLGYFKDSPKLFEEAVKYLSNPTAKEIKLLEPKIDELKTALVEATAVIKALTRVLLNPIDKELAEAAQVFDPNNQVEIVEVIDAHEEVIHAAVVDEDAVTEAAQPAVEVTYDDVKKATNNLSAAKGKEVTIGVLSRFGVKRATELTREQWLPYIVYADNVTRGAIDA